MPGFDGKGPAGAGPMTGRGRGFCIMELPQNGRLPQIVSGILSDMQEPVCPDPSHDNAAQVGARIRKVQPALNTLDNRIDTLDDFVEKMQAQILEETRETYGEVAFQRWLNPLYMGNMEDPDGYARLTGPCGDTMEIFLRFENDRVTKASFLTDGCGGSVVCGSIAAELAVGNTPDELIDVTGEEIIKVLGRFPKEDQHCCFLAAETLQESLNDYMIKQKNKPGRR